MQSVEAFLEDTFGSVQPTSDAIGGVTVDPNEAVQINEAEAKDLAGELTRCIRDSTGASIPAQGYYIEPSEKSYPLLKKYLQSITLHRDAAISSWVQVLPPGGAIGR